MIAGINPWNFPFSTPTRKAVPALVHGNAIVLKPASIAPGAVAAMVAAEEGIFPDGLLSCVLGGGALGQALAEHPGVDAVSFTGSVGVGKRVAAAASSHLAEISLELGGKNPAVLNDASDLDAALDQIAAAAMAVTGQRCTAISRVIVRAELAEAAIEGLAGRLSAIEPTDGASDGATMGPLASRQQLEDVAGFVERARAEGARIVTGGERIETEAGGHFYAPTLVADVTPGMEIARDEVFGPVLAVLTYRDLDEAMRIANGVEFGLTSCLYSEEAPVIERFLAESESGMLHVNAGSFPENHTPLRRREGQRHGRRRLERTLYDPVPHDRAHGLPPGGRLTGRIALTVADGDDVATLLDEQTALECLADGTPVVPGIPFGHKAALRDIAAGEAVRKYGVVIGHATENIAAGEHVHVHNLA